MKKTIPLLILLVVGIFLYSCSSNGNASNKAMAGKDSSQTDSTKNNADNSKNKNKKGWKNNQKDEAIPVEVTTIQTGPISSYILLSSNLETENMVDIYSRVQGLVEKINADEGDYVRKGQVLIELEDDEYSLAEQRARVGYEEQKNA
ncbi:MAG: biotin/lipoyl-binding protein, partial [Calditrichia bacterium]